MHNLNRLEAAAAVLLEREAVGLAAVVEQITPRAAACVDLATAGNVMASKARGRRVLVVNDDARFAESVRGLLSDEGYEARAVHDGATAVEVVTEWQPDVVLLDLFMPRLDGWEFLRRRADTPALQGARVLVWSVGDAEELEFARRLGADVCLRRATTTPDQLLDSIAGLLDQPSG